MLAASSTNDVFFLAVSLLLLLPCGSILHARAQQETDDEMEFSYRRGEDDGPERWGLIRRDWAACSFGLRQSPIHISDVAAGHGRRPGRLLRSYRPAAATLVNRGHDIMVRFDGDAGGVVIDGVAYRLRQMHWHSPSEHAVDGRRYDLELHMLHQSDSNGRYAVVAQLLEIGRRRDATLHMLEPYIRRMANKRKGHEVEIDDDVDPRWPVSSSGVYYRYTGSFTTPPCTEGITWTVARNVRRVSRQQVELLREAVHDGARSNARPLQEANGRGVGVYYCWPNA
uniref:Carbonic anhydrase n=1 Tax=Oryza meyeriana var. granulata TaxID=110450 RepID=C0JAF4_9ORYZ|nr:unknown [Oryza meyeriana var. granulata]